MKVRTVSESCADAGRHKALPSLCRIVVVLCSSMVFMAGCARGTTSRKPPIHPNPNMDRQPKYLPQGESRFFYNGAVMQQPVEGTIARGDLREDQEYYTGRSVWGDYIFRVPLDSNEALLERGKERFEIFCLPCHGPDADGKGMLYERAQIKSANLLEERIQQMGAGQIFHVMTNGLGLMPSYRSQIPVRDRWAIVSYVRKLQKQQQ